MPEQQPEQFSEYGWPQETAASSGPAFYWPQIDFSNLRDMPQGYTEPYLGPSGSGHTHGYSVPPGSAPRPGPGSSR